MSTSTITVGGQSVTLVALPTAPERRMVEWNAEDAVASVESIFTRQTQVQQWPGADLMSGTMTMPKMTVEQADAWISCLLECRGIANAFLIGDPLKKLPRGTGGSMTVSGSNLAGSQFLNVSGWSSGALLPGDMLQIDYRLYRVLENANPIPIWPSLREVPTNGGAVITTNAVGLFRRANNKLTWSAEVGNLTTLSFQIKEYR